MKKNNIRPLGDILLEMEPLLDELVEHGLQTGDILALVFSHLRVHSPEAFEVYEESMDHPEFYYGPRRRCE